MNIHFNGVPVLGSEELTWSETQFCPLQLFPKSSDPPLALAETWTFSGTFGEYCLYSVRAHSSCAQGTLVGKC